MQRHEAHKGSPYIKITSFVYVGLSKCCRPAFALVDGRKADINLQEVETNPELLLSGANFINNLVNQKIKVFINYEDEDSKGINLVVAYLITKGLDVKKAVSIIEKKLGISLNPDMFNKFKEFLKKRR